jgi:hypothetical protein
MSARVLCYILNHMTDEIEYIGKIKAECDALNSWISVEKRMPKKDKMVLLTDTRNVYVGRNQGESWYVVSTFGVFGTIKYWMPLPLPPRA